MKQFKMC